MSLLNYSIVGPTGVLMGAAANSVQGLAQYAPGVVGSISNFANSIILETILLIIGFIVITQMIKKAV